MGRFLFALALIGAASQAWAAQEPEDDGSYHMLVSAGVGRFTGDYGQDDSTTLDVLSLSARWYLPRTELQVSVPFLRIDGASDVTFIDGQPITVGEDSGSDVQRVESGLGDVVLRGEYYLHTGTRTLPWVIGLVRVKLPTGSEAKGMGSGHTDVEAGIGLIQRLGPVSLLADAGYIVVGSDDEDDASNEVRLGGGVSVPFGADNRSSTYLYFENRTSRFVGPDRRSIAAGVSTGLGSGRRLRLSASAFFGLSESTEDVGVYLTVGRRF